MNGTGATAGAQANTAVLNAGYAMIEIAIGLTVRSIYQCACGISVSEKEGKEWIV